MSDATTTPTEPPASRRSRHRRARRNADVWTWRERKYRVRALVLLTLNFLVFAGVCVFTHWLHTGEPFDFSPESYFEPFRFWGGESTNLNDFVLAPIDVRQTRMHGVVLGLLVAVIVAVPIAVAILYRFQTSLPFIGVVLLLAHMPWMAISLTGSCILAAVRPFRLRFRYGAALVGLLPVMAYLYFATRSANEEMVLLTRPEERVLLMLPWVLALIAAAVMFAVILIIARTVNYRPGAVLPVLAAMAITPAVLFHTRVGPDELAYRVLEERFGPQSTLFRPVVDATPQIRALVRDYDPDPREILQAWSGEVDSLLRRGVRAFLLDLLEAQAAADAACTRFYQTYPQSRHTAAVLYIHARALDTRLSEERLKLRQERALYFEFPHPRSERPWSVLWKQYPDSPFAIVAGLRLAQLHLRQGDADAALERLRPIVLRRGGTAADAPLAPPDLLQPEAAWTALPFKPEPYLKEALELYELIRLNSADPQYGNEPLQKLASLDPRRTGGYKQQLLRLIDAYPDALLYDNLVVQWANSFSQPSDRAHMLSRCLEHLPTGDARLEAAYRLASLEVQTLPDDSGATRERGLQRLGTLAHEHGHTIWGWLAEERLDQLGPVTAATQRN